MQASLTTLVEGVINHFEIKISDYFEHLFIFNVKLEPMIPHDNSIKQKEILQTAWQDITQVIGNFNSYFRKPSHIWHESHIK